MSLAFADSGRSPRGRFELARVEHPGALPEASPDAIDVALLDMNHGWPNLGHDSLAGLVRDVSEEAAPALDAARLRLRVLSFEVRRFAMLPEAPGPRYSLYLGSGGPGHVDPRGNDGVAACAQGIREDPHWEAPAFALFDAIRAHPQAALLAVCHSFGVLCRWSGAAAPVLRGPEKGKCAGVRENVLSEQALDHPWFAAFAARLGPGRRFRVLENRLFDLLPSPAAPAWALPLAFEAAAGGGPGEALTMFEFARDADGVVPRILAVNHHPEILDRGRQLALLEEKRRRGDVSAEWYRERRDALTASLPDLDLDRSLRLTSELTLLGPLRFHLLRAIRLRAEALGRTALCHEREAVGALTGKEREPGASTPGQGKG